MHSEADNGTDSSGCFRSCVTLTPEIIRATVKELHTRRVYVEAKLIEQHLRWKYPNRMDDETFRREVRDKLDRAVRVGLLLKHEEDSYYLPTFRQQAMYLDDRDLGVQAGQERNATRGNRKSIPRLS